MVSAPAGTGAPVMMRMASPSTSTCCDHPPAATSPTTSPAIANQPVTVKDSPDVIPIGDDHGMAGLPIGTAAPAMASALPVVAETYDGGQNDINGFHVKAEHVRAAIDAAKGGVVNFTKTLGTELGPLGIRVGCVRPGAVFTEINQRAGLGDADTAYQRLVGLGSAHALGRIGTVQEIAEAYEYLVRAEWTTGNVLTVDGGMVM